MNLVLGANGRLGRAIVPSLPVESVLAPARSLYAEWWRDGAADLVSRFLEGQAVEPETVYVAAGIIDPARPADEHHQVNYLLARNVIEGATKLGFRVVTFGTVMEEIVGDKSNNPYLSSKFKLGNYVENFSVELDLALHVRIHTLFGGGAPEACMFLGQIFHSLVKQIEFKMSPGMQLREYHHIDDEVLAIRKLLAAGASGAIALSHGAPVTLKDLAAYIFEGFQCPELLKVGALPGPVNDNYGVLFGRPHEIDELAFRATLPSVLDYLHTCFEPFNRQPA